MADMAEKLKYEPIEPFAVGEESRILAEHLSNRQKENERETFEEMFPQTLKLMTELLTGEGELDAGIQFIYGINPEMRRDDLSSFERRELWVGRGVTERGKKIVEALIDEVLSFSKPKG